MDGSTDQRVKEGGSNFRMVIEGYSSSAETAFGALIDDLRDVASQSAPKFSKSDGGNAKVEGALRSLIDQNQKTQQVLGQERKGRELEKKASQRTAEKCYVIEQEQQFPATDEQNIKGELAQEASKRFNATFPGRLRRGRPGF